MRTPRRRARIPAGIAALVVSALLGALGACSDDDGSGGTSEVSIGDPITVVSTVPASITSGTTIPLPPEDTTDIPLPPPPATGDIPTVPETSDVPVFLTATVGVDTSPARVDTVPFGAPVTIEIVNPVESDEFRLQGYELGAGQVVGPGEPITIQFQATITGDFVLESVATGDVLLTVRVG